MASAEEHSPVQGSSGCNSTTLVDPLSYPLPWELALRVLSFIDSPRKLSQLYGVSRRWQSLCSDDILWMKLVERRWKNKLYHHLDLHIRVDYTNLMESLSVKEMKSLLKRRQVSVAGLVEKSELADAVVKSLPQFSPTVPSKNNSGKWRTSYIVAELDSKRTRITKSEVTGIEWKFRFRHWQEGLFVKATFDDKFNLVIPDIFDNVMRYRFFDNNSSIRVEQYPELHDAGENIVGWT
ncbi:hypothetical protein SmJEL517_g00654 [Synchytrium microbalum]|uniref:F-box domain-containing protein n=1 Tax=Synchytrium microbalum TaxID=1806994 RepID=A0A507C953_9FUNG|nr:uncharacterized protein SmJEL517_g00654 [Synchytrium microbalum]TPX37597.1 hypothetical protein SmJEL517_g00654 [Synchytrium microbalum]